MARYICSYKVNLPIEKLKPILDEVLKGCNCNVIYHTIDYIMAQEIPGQVLFSKLATVEVFIDSTTATNNEVQVNLVVKNDELPLQINNRCRQLFERIQKLLAENHQWILIPSVPV